MLVNDFVDDVLVSAFETEFDTIAPRLFHDAPSSHLDGIRSAHRRPRQADALHHPAHLDSMAVPKIKRVVIKIDRTKSILLDDMPQ